MERAPLGSIIAHSQSVDLGKSIMGDLTLLDGNKIEQETGESDIRTHRTAEVPIHPDGTRIIVTDTLHQENNTSMNHTINRAETIEIIGILPGEVPKADPQADGKQEQLMATLVGGG